MFHASKLFHVEQLCWWIQVWWGFAKNFCDSCRRRIAQFQGRIGGRGRVSLRGEERARSLTSRTSHLAIVNHRRENIRNATASSSPREAIAWTASPKKATTCGRVRWPKLSGCPEVVETRKECVGEPGMPIPSRQLIDNLRPMRRRGCQAIVPGLSFLSSASSGYRSCSG